MKRRDFFKTPFVSTLMAADSLINNNINWNTVLDWVADSTGNANGIVEEWEKNNVLDVLKRGNGMLYLPNRIGKVYPSIQSIKEAYTNMIIMDGFGVLEVTKYGIITNYFDAGTGHISTNNWKEDKRIIKHFTREQLEKKMRERRDYYKNLESNK